MVIIGLSILSINPLLSIGRSPLPVCLSESGLHGEFPRAFVSFVCHNYIHYIIILKIKQKYRLLVNAYSIQHFQVQTLKDLLSRRSQKRIPSPQYSGSLGQTCKQAHGAHKNFPIEDLGRRMTTDGTLALAGVEADSCFWPRPPRAVLKQRRIPGQAHTVENSRQKLPCLAKL